MKWKPREIGLLHKNYELDLCALWGSKENTTSTHAHFPRNKNILARWLVVSSQNNQTWESSYTRYTECITIWCVFGRPGYPNYTVQTDAVCKLKSSRPKRHFQIFLSFSASCQCPLIFSLSCRDFFLLYKLSFFHLPIRYIYIYSLPFLSTRENIEHL